MKKKQKVGLASLILAASVFLTSSGSTNEKNDTNEPVSVMPNVTAESICNYQEVTTPLEYSENNVLEDENLNLGSLDLENDCQDVTISDNISNTSSEENNISQEETIQKEKYPFGYIMKNTGIYNVIFDKEEKIEAYQKVVILDKLEKVTLVEYVNEDNETMVGYVLNEVLGELSDTFIEIDISDQTIKMYIAGDLALESVVVTGNAYTTPTPTGYFNVLEKKEHTFLRGFNSDGSLKYCRFIDHGVRFYQGYIIHDAEEHTDPEIGITFHGWRKPEEFGGDTYLTHGSNGCPNTLNKVAEFIYENSQEQTETQTGTEVLIHR